jgi:anti-sigma factor RsiW
MIDCKSATLRLDDYVDGALAADEKAEVEAHLATCAACRDELESLRALLARAASLPRTMPPPARLWSAIESEIQTRRAPLAFAAPSRFSVPLLAAAAVVLMLLSSGATALWLQRTTPDYEFTTARAEYTQATAELAKRVQANPAGLSPTTIAVLDRNLAIIDAAIREAEQALETDPGDSSLEEMLLARYQQRLELLQRAARAGQES